jgi:type II secretory pathway pseudopilin PulG
MNRKGCILRFKSSLPLIFVSHLISHVSRKRGFTVVEFLVGVLIALLILGAISVAFIGANRGFQQNKPISQAIQEAQNSVVTLDFLFSRWGIGVPWLNTIPIYSMDYDGTIQTDGNGNPINWQPASLLPNGIVFPPAYPFWYLVADTNGDGKNDTIYFFASLGGTGYVINCPNNAPPCNILSCRLTSNNKKNVCYFIFSADGTSIKYYELGSSDLANDNIDCLNLQNNQTSNTTINVGGLSPGDRFQRVPHLIRIYETPIDSRTSWLAFDRIDLSDGCNDNENTTYIGRIRRGSFQVIPMGQNSITPIGQIIGQNAVELQADFVDENGNVAYRFRKVYAK